MASGGTCDLVGRVKKFREIDVLQHERVPDVQGTLSMVRKFLLEHETPTANDCTHTVFDNFQDWWMGSKLNYKLTIAEDNTLDKFYECISVFYDLGIPLTLMERRTPEISFFQDIEIWGSKDSTLCVEDLMDTGSRFALLLGKAMGEVYPEEEFLDVAVFDATGFSRTKGVMKTSVRLVWFNLVVDKDRAARIRDYVVHKFQDSKSEDVLALESRMLGLNKDNRWTNVFSDTIYSGRFGIRMPLCDRVSPAPLRKPERRPFAPVGVFRFSYGNGEVEKVEKIYSTDGLQGVEWLKKGCIRHDVGTPLTKWTPPTWNGQRAPRTCDTNSDLTASVLPPPRRAPGPVRVRTRVGSDGAVRAQPRNPQQIEREMCVEREFQGTLGDFRDKLEQQFDVKEQDVTVVEGVIIWRYDDTGARIEFKAANHRVYFLGKIHQIRTLLDATAVFTKPIGADAARSSTQTARSANGSRGGSEFGGSGHTPSAVYAPPSVAHASSALGSCASGSASHISSACQGGRGREPVKAITVCDFQPQGQSELALKVNDYVTVNSDPEEGQYNMHRWVYGLNETTQNSGWFLSSCVRPLRPTEAAELLPK